MKFLQVGLFYICLIILFFDLSKSKNIKTSDIRCGRIPIDSANFKGKEANDWPWLYFLNISNACYTKLCNAQLISPSFLLTSAHCLFYNYYSCSIERKNEKLILRPIQAKNIVHEKTMVLNLFDEIKIIKNNKIHNVVDYFVHEDYEGQLDLTKNFFNDIAVLKLDKPITTNEPVCLASFFDPIKEKINEGYAVGYFTNELNSSVFDNILREVRVNIVGAGVSNQSNNCDKSWGINARICTENENKEELRSDSGSAIHTAIHTPLANIFFTHGVLSGFNKTTDVYCDIESKCKWIALHTNNEAICINKYNILTNKKFNRLEEAEVKNEIIRRGQPVLKKRFQSDYYEDNAEKLPNNDFEEDNSEINSEATQLLTLCQRGCLEKVSEEVKSAIQSSDHYERYKGICLNYNNTVQCMDKLEGKQCRNQKIFDIVSIGLFYICIEQRNAFEAVIECIDTQTDQVEKECESVCHVKERMAHWANESEILKNFMKQTLRSLTNGEEFATKMLGRNDQGLGILIGNGLHQNAEMLKAALVGAEKTADERIVAIKRGKRPISPLEEILTIDKINKDLQVFVQDGCELAKCQLTCIRSKFDTKCRGYAGSLFSEAFVKAISYAKEIHSNESFAHLMGAFLPNQCDFMFKKEEVLNKFLMPQELGETLHYTYDYSDE